MKKLLFLLLILTKNSLLVSSHESSSNENKYHCEIKNNQQNQKTMWTLISNSFPLSSAIIAGSWFCYSIINNFFKEPTPPTIKKEQINHLTFDADSRKHSPCVTENFTQVIVPETTNECINECVHEHFLHNNFEKFNDTLIQQQEIHKNFTAQFLQVKTVIDDAQTAHAIFQESGFQHNNHLEKRIAAFNEITDTEIILSPENSKAFLSLEMNRSLLSRILGSPKPRTLSPCVGVIYTSQSYYISPATADALEKNNIDTTLFSTCYGNNLQQIIHQECIAVITHTTQLPTNSPLYDYKNDLISFADAAREYNQLGFTSNAMRIVDVCWTMLDYGKAIVEGIAQGTYCAVEDMIEHPVQTALSIVAAEYVLAYQLSKIVFDVADIGITALHDATEAYKKWNEYIDPINQLIDGINNKQITMRDALKGTAAFAASWKAQSKLLGGLHNFCSTAKNKAVAFAQNNPQLSPDHYMTTPDGILLKAVGNIENKKQLPHIAQTQTDSNIIKREIVFPKVKTYEQARNKALEIIGDVDVHTGKPHYGNVGIGEGKIVGRRWHDRKVVIRLDWDEKKGPHVNVSDYRKGKGNAGISAAIQFEGTKETVENLLKHLQR